MSQELPTRLSNTPPPEPLVDGRQKIVLRSGKQLRVVANIARPRVIVFTDLLSQSECEKVMTLCRDKLSRSEVVGDTGSHQADDRTSFGAHLTREDHPFIGEINARFAELLRWPEEKSESLHVLRYRPGNEYQPHWDYFDEKKPSFADQVGTGGNRLATLIVYLQNAEEGGGTYFPNLGLTVTPPRGGAVFFSYSQQDPEAAMGTLHAGSPVVRGEKWIVTKWLRESAFT